MKANFLSKKTTKAFFDQVLISPITGDELSHNGEVYQTIDGNEEYSIINDIPIVIDKKDFNEYLENKYTEDFKYFRSWDFAFVKNLKEKLEIKPDSLLLDVGGGEGFYSKCFNDLMIKTITADFSKYQLEKGKKKYPSLNFIAVDANKIPFPDNTFDVIFCSGLSSFSTKELSKSLALVDHLMGKLKTGGTLVFIHITNLTGKMNKNWYNITYDDLNYLFNKYEVTHKWFIPRPLVSNILNQLGFTLASSKFFGFIVKLTSFLSSKIRGRLIYIIKKD